MNESLELIDIICDTPCYIRLTINNTKEIELGYYATLFKYNQLIVSIDGIEPLKF